MANRAAGGYGPRLGLVYGLFAVGFLAFSVALAVLEQIGLPDRILGYALAVVVFVLFAVFGIASRTMILSDYLVSGRRVPAVYNGMAAAADWLSGTIFLGLAGTVYSLGYDGLAFILGWSGGFVLLAVAIAPRLRASDALTAPDFLGQRYGSRLVRLAAVLVLIACSFFLLVAEIGLFGTVAARFLAVPFDVAIGLGIVILLCASLLGGMRAVTWTQAAQYIVLAIAFLIPVALIATRLYGTPLPQLAYGDLLDDIAHLQGQMLAQGTATTAELNGFLAPFRHLDAFNFTALVFCMTLGTAAMPYLLMRYLTTPSVRETRRSVAWSFLFVALFYLTVPAYALFAKLEIYANVVGATVSDLPQWIFTFGKAGFIRICGVDAGSLYAVRQACAAGGVAAIRLADFSIDPKALVTALPAIADLPFVAVALIAVGTLSAALSTANGTLLAIGNSLGHDVFFASISPRAPAGSRLFAARLGLMLTVAVAVYLVFTGKPDVETLVPWSFSLAAAGLFPALFLGMWWKRATWVGALAGMAAGLGVTLYYLVSSVYGPDLLAASGDEIHWGFIGLTDKVDSISAGVFGVPAAFLVMVIVSLFTQPRPARHAIATAPSEEGEESLAT